MAQNDFIKSNFNSPFIWVLALCTIVLVGFKSYDYYLGIELKQSKIELTQEEKVEQDSIRAFVERGKMACRVCDDYQDNNPNRISKESSAAIVIGFFLFVGACFMWAFKDFY
jgi:hypothetical protein